MKKFLKSLFTDKEWDFDLAKVMGFVAMVFGFTGFLMGKEQSLVMGMLGFGAGLLGISKAKGD